MWPRFGVKIGNSTLCIASVKADGKAEVIANKQGDRVSQACLLWNGVDEIECGLTAKQKMATRPQQAVANSFQLLLPHDQLTAEKVAAAQREIPCGYDSDTHTFQLSCTTPSNKEDEDVTVTHSLSAYQAKVLLLGAELELARQYQSDPDEKPIVVLSVPGYYPTASWRQLSEAAEEAGFHVAAVIAEESAALLGYGLGEAASDSSSSGDAAKKEEEATPGTTYVLTIKSGGLFSHFAVFAVCPNGLYTQLESYGPFALGGRQYTNALVQFICDEFQRKYKLDPHESRRSLAKIRTAAAASKHILTTLTSTQVYIDSLMDGIDFNMQVSRGRFESLILTEIGDFMQKLGECVDDAIAKHPAIKAGFDSVVLLGATMQIPKLQSVVAARFPSATVHSTPSPDQVVAMGCARQAALLFAAGETVLERTDEFQCVDEDFVIWHGADDSEAQTLFGKGTCLPNTARIDIKLKECPDGQADVLHLRSGQLKTEAVLDGLANAVAEGQDTLSVEVGISFAKETVSNAEGDSEEKLVPVMKLRCI